MHHSFVIKMLLGAAIPLCMTLASGIALYLALQSSLYASSKMLKQQTIIASANNLKLRFVDAETGQRGYVLTGDEAFLLPYEQASDSFGLMFDSLKAMVEGQAEQVSRLDNAVTLFERWQSEAAVISIERRREGIYLPDVSNLERGKQLVDNFRLLMNEFTDAANAMLQAHQRESVVIAHRANLIALLGFGSAWVAALVMWALLANRTALSVSGVTQAAKRMAEGEWETRAPVIGRDELSEMAVAFNQMAERLETMVSDEQQARQSLEQRVDDMVASRTKEMFTMNRLIEMLQSCHRRDEALLVLGSMLPGLFTTTSGALLLKAEVGDYYHAVVAWGDELLETEQPLAEVDCWALRRGKPYEAKGTSGHELVCPHVLHKPGRHFCVPLSAHGNMLGVLHIGATESGSREWESRKQLAQIVAEQVSLSLANIQLRERLQQQSVRDPLTGLYNRRYLEESIQRELGRAKREQLPLSVIMLDLDHFKQVNDTYGHSAGDKVLIAVGELLKTALRGEDLICRFGGEEFTMILPSAGLDVTLERANQLRESIEQLSIVLDQESAITVTCSLGVATFPNHARDAQALLDLADGALYEAKRAGRNRVMIAARQLA